MVYLSSVATSTNIVGRAAYILLRLFLDEREVGFMYRNFHIRLFCGKGRQEPDQEEKERKPLFGFGKKRKEPSKLVSILNRYSLLFHAVLACAICFGIELFMRL